MRDRVVDGRVIRGGERAIGPVASWQAPTRRRFGSWTLLVLALVLLASAVVVVPQIALNSQVARETLIARLSEMTGRPVSISGPIGFSLLPRTRLTVDRVRIGDARSTVVDRIVADLDPADALLGRANISRLVLVRPEFRASSAATDGALQAPLQTAAAPSPVATTGTGKEGRGVPLPTGAGNDAGKGPLSGLRPILRGFLIRFRGLQILEIQDGVLRTDPSGANSGFSNANLTVTQSSIGAPMTIAGSFIWNGQPTDVDATISAPEGLLADGNSGIDVAIGAPALNTHFAGSISLNRDNAISGRLQLSLASLGRGLEWLGDPKVRIPDLGAVSFDGDLLLAGYDAALSDVDVSVAGSTGHGVLEASFGASRPTIGGTLAFATLDLTPLARALAPLPGDAYDFTRPIDLAFADTLHLDLRLSARQAALGRVAMADMAAVVSIADGALKMDVGDASLFGGHGRATLRLVGSPNQATANGDMALTGVDMAALFSALKIDALHVTGRSDLTAQMTTPMRDWQTIARNIRVDARIDATNGAISGFDPAVFAGAGARPLSAGLSGSRVPFTSLIAELGLAGSTVRLERLALTNSGGEIVAAGRFAPLGRDVAIDGEFAPSHVLAGAAGPSGPAGASQSGEKIAFALDGKWPDPSVTTFARAEVDRQEPPAGNP